MFTRKFRRVMGAAQRGLRAHAVTAFIALTWSLFALPAHASYFEFSIDDPAGSASAGDIRNITTRFDPDSQVFSWSSTIDRHNGNLADGFWLVISDGPNPKSHHNEYAILYGDTVNNRLTSYVYNGVNSSNSWSNPGEFIQSWSGVLDVTDSNGGDTRETSFSVDATALNAYTPTQPGTNDWDGLLFGEGIGVWFHPVALVNAQYDVDGSLTAFSHGAMGWYDTGGQQADLVLTEGNGEEVPAPAPLVLMLGLASLGLLRRRFTLTFDEGFAVRTAV